ncbi:peptidylprolyl isomerase [Echinicola strongylocentroti]|uniref:peptidylprolyl isomerase n=1 Tax=Echinicola strongylocentroti TaxID=1795355 RepID=A0A2Z4IH49_9BACT|nr:peptidylprolyl isomerase [Echinicola strongylocentroti]AWW30314.1 peptidylprolyl isomerase [Echinicola strongylocentroti]
MKRVLKTVFTMSAVALLSSCMNNEESAYEKQVKEENQELADYINQNGIQAEQTTAGYYYSRELDVEDGQKFNDEDIIGIYYEMETLEGAFIEAHTEEDGEPIKFKYDRERQTLAPIVVNQAIALAELGETLVLYVPSYLAYSDYSYNQLIPQYANMKITVHFEKIYAPQEVATIEDNLIQGYIDQNGLEGFEKVEEGVYLKVVEAGDEDTEASKNGNSMRFTFEMFELGQDDSFSKSLDNSVTTTLGDDDNYEFLNIGFKDRHKDAEVQIIASSATSFVNTAQVIPDAIRKDYFDQGYLNIPLRPFTPILFEATIESID